MESDATPRREGDSRIRNRVTLALAFAILLPSLWGFGSKFREFLMLVRGEVDGAFALTPVVNYLLASLGFLCLFGWAAMGGMFHDIEQPKRDMLDTEALLDRVSQQEKNAPNPSQHASQHEVHS